MSFTVLEPSSINSTATFTFANVSVSGNISTGSNTNSNLGNSATANYFIGNGSLLTGLPAQYANSNVANYLPTYTGNVAGNYFIGNGSQLTGLPSGYANSDVAAYLPTYTGNVSANYFIGNGSQLTGLPASYSNTNVAAYLPTYTGNVSANYFIGNGSTLTNITGANVTGYVPNATNANAATTASTVTTAAQPNITSIGTLSNLTVSGDTTISGNLTVNGNTEYTNVTNLYVKDPIIEMGGNANGAPLTSNDGKDRGTLLHYYTSSTVDAFMGWDNSNSEFGFGSNVSISSEVVTWNNYGNIRAGYFIGNGSLLTGISAGSTYSNTNVAAYLPTYTGNVSANYFIGNGSTLTNITGANVTGYVPNATNANVSTTAGTVTTAAQPNITSTGTLSSLSVSGLITATGTGIKVANIQDSTGTIAITTRYNNQAGDVGVYGNIVAGTSGDGNITATYFIGNGSQLTGISAGSTYSNTNVAAYLPTYTGNVSANYFIGNGSRLTFITGANVTGYVPLATAANTATSATTAGTVTTAAQPNITSIGTLSNLTVTGNISAGNLTGTTYVAGTLTTAAQPNITSVGTLSSLTVSGTATITTGNITTGNFGNSVFTKYQEKVVAGGSVSGTITPDAAAGTIYTYTLTGAITLNALTNAVAGTSMTIILTQGGTGSYGLTSTMKFAGGAKSLSSAVGAIDIISVFYDGTNYYAIVSRSYA
jgi:hypothetical protein